MPVVKGLSMQLSFEKPVSVVRPHGSYRLDVFSLKAGRKMTLYGMAPLFQFIELECNPSVKKLCEYPYQIPDSKPNRVVDFWAIQDGVSTFYLLVRPSEAKSIDNKKRHFTEFEEWVKKQNAHLKLVSIDSFDDAHVRHENWLTILQHLVTHQGQITPALIEKLSIQMTSDFCLRQIEGRLRDFDAMLVRAAVFSLLMNGKINCPSINTLPFNDKTLMRRS
jgi:hypothetical protein